MVVHEIDNNYTVSQIKKPDLRFLLIDNLKEILPIYSPTYEETAMSAYVRGRLRAGGWNVTSDRMGNIMAVRGERPAAGYTLLNVHMDTCQSEDDRDIGEYLRYDEERGIFLAESPDGDRYQIGGDDKAGISTILTLARGTDLPFKILATVREEEGQQGVQEVPPDFYADCAFGLTLDRRGRGDIIPTYHGRTCAPDHIVTNLMSLGEEEGMDYWKTCGGSIADTYYIAEHIPALNISTGYYNPHTCLDYIRVDETYGALRLAKACIEHPERLLRRPAPSD
ncbi:MAG: hypothetical protein GXX82_15085 [Syntrophorhabdus sp.]|nr:hypothetical protein [Syntrophorhabdus sp.]